MLWIHYIPYWLELELLPSEHSRATELQILSFFTKSDNKKNQTKTKGWKDWVWHNDQAQSATRAILNRRLTAGQIIWFILRPCQHEDVYIKTLRVEAEQ